LLKVSIFCVPIYWIGTRALPERRLAEGHIRGH